jgi:hypothetical protein
VSGGNGHAGRANGALRQHGADEAHSSAGYNLCGSSAKGATRVIGVRACIGKHRIDLFFDRHVGNCHAHPLLQPIYPATESSESLVLWEALPLKLGKAVIP